MACQEMGIAAQAKALMLRHAPKTARFGSAFDEGTHLAYLAQTRSSTACPDEPTLRLQLLALALSLQVNLPRPAVHPNHYPSTLTMKRICQQTLSHALVLTTSWCCPA